jgi:hypothetical protein
VSCTVRRKVRSRAVMERIGMQYAGAIRSRGRFKGIAGKQDGAPFAVCAVLRTDWNATTRTEESVARYRC